jgi:hypothetical protein
MLLEWWRMFNQIFKNRPAVQQEASSTDLFCAIGTTIGAFNAACVTP